MGCSRWKALVEKCEGYGLRSPYGVSIHSLWISEGYWLVGEFDL